MAGAEIYPGHYLLSLFIFACIGLVLWADFQKQNYPPEVKEHNDDMNDGIQLRMMWIVFCVYSLLQWVVGEAVRLWFLETSSPLVIKRTIAACCSGPLGMLAFYALFVDPETGKQEFSYLEGRMTWWNQVAIGTLQGYYCGDLFWLNSTQIRMTSYLVHHIGFLTYSQLVWLWPELRWLFLVGQLTELLNPFWYSFWVMHSSQWYRAGEWREKCYLFSGVVSWFGYLLMRSVWVWMGFGIRYLVLALAYRSWSTPQICVQLAVTIFYGLINAQNIWKLTGALRKSCAPELSEIKIKST